MMSTLVCSQCSEVKVETSRSVVLPFVCSGCQGTILASPYPAGAYDDPSVQAQPEGAGELNEELPDETATTLSTIDLIRDLEDQLTVAKDLTTGQTELIAQLEQQNAIFTDRIAELTEMSNVKDVFIKALNQAGIEVAQDFAAIAHALAFHYGFETARRQRLEQENVLLKRAVEIVGAIAGVGVRVIAS
jgi:hypothetical protein